MLIIEKHLYGYIIQNLKFSLSSIGFSNFLIDDLANNLKGLNVKKFGTKHKNELNKIYSVGFFQKIVPKYFSKYIIPEILPSKKVLDLGCGTGVLANILSKSNKFQQIIGIDLNSYPEWKIFKNSKITFKIVREKNFSNFLSKNNPDVVILTWALHHMKNKEQNRYIKYLYDAVKPNAQLIILEDAYSTKLMPENGIKIHKSFMNFSKRDRQKIMRIYDWVANKALAQRKKVNIPNTNRTLEEWEMALRNQGFKIIKTKFIGFPQKRDINTPQGLLILKK